MAYPTLEQYNEVFQYPQLALVDPALKSGQIKMTGMGTPLALCGGFALTYTLTVGIKKFAIRCFHKQSLDLESRYLAISSKIKSLNSPYFLDFEFQPKGVKVNGVQYPLVKMAWATGITLGEFLEQNYKNKGLMQNLQKSLRELANYLESNNISHGDISPDNIMVSNNGYTLQLIDYDGMFVDAFRGKKSTELGNRNFQHMKRTADHFSHTLDRFSFILLDVAIEALINSPNLWKTTQSEATAVIFRANDYASPENSTVFQELFRHPVLGDIAKRFAAVSKADFEKIPSVSDFVSNRNIPQVSLSATTSSVVQYLASFPVIDAGNYQQGLKHVGDRVELIGRITEVKLDRSRQGKPYVFINFGSWRGNIIKLSIWSEGLDALSDAPNNSWIGRWVSVSGLMDPPYVSAKFKYSHLSIGITKNNQIQFINESQAKFRLAGSATRSPTSQSSGPSNKELLKQIKSNDSTQPNQTVVRTVAHSGTQTKTATSNNQAILQGIKSNKQPNSNNVKVTPPPSITNARTTNNSVWASSSNAHTPSQPKSEESMMKKIIKFFIG
jgi:serine/threonine protein kinase